MCKPLSQIFLDTDLSRRSQFYTANRSRPADATNRVNGAAKFPRVLSPIINVLANILRASRLEIPRRLL